MTSDSVRCGPIVCLAVIVITIALLLWFTRSHRVRDAHYTSIRWLIYTTHRIASHRRRDAVNEIHKIMVNNRYSMVFYETQWRYNHRHNSCVLTFRRIHLCHHQFSIDCMKKRLINWKARARTSERTYKWIYGNFYRVPHMRIAHIIWLISFAIAYIALVYVCVFVCAREFYFTVFKRLINYFRKILFIARSRCSETTLSRQFFTSFLLNRISLCVFFS